MNSRPRGTARAGRGSPRRQVSGSGLPFIRGNSMLAMLNGWINWWQLVLLVLLVVLIIVWMQVRKRQ